MDIRQFFEKKNITNKTIKKHSIENYLIRDIINVMLEFQKSNNVKGECLANVSYLYSSIKASFPALNPVVKSVIVYGFNEDGNDGLISGHVIIQIGDLLYDPSYEVISLKDKLYFETLTDMKSILNFDTCEDGNQMMKWSIEKMIKFHKFADEINYGEYLITDKVYLNNMADYVDLNLSK